MYKFDGRDVVAAFLDKMAEFPDVGQQCAIKTCSQLDFLPFECELCRQTFCLQHRTPSAHNCAQLPALSCDYTGPTGTIQSFECSLSTCKTRELMPVVCTKCCNNYCLTHRHPVDHECASVTKVVKDSHKPIVAPKAVQAPACRGRKSQRTSLLVALMKLKMKAKGLAAIPVGDRIYFEIQIIADDQSVTRGYFFSKDWTVGKSVDYVAAEEKLTNLNNIMGSKKLRFFKADEDKELFTGSPWSELIECGSIENGSTVILKYVEPSNE